MIYSIVTGQGFTGNAQRFYDDYQIYSSYNHGIYNSGYTLDNYLYNISFKYRSNCSIYLSNEYTSDLGYGMFPINTGNAKQIILTNCDGSINYGYYLGFSTNSYFTMSSESNSTITTPTTPGTIMNFTLLTGLEITSGISLFVQSSSSWFTCTVTSYDINNGQTVANSITNSSTGTYSYWWAYYAGGAWFEIDEVNLFRIT